MINKKDINFIIEAHNKKGKRRKKGIRIFDGKTPYYVHCLWSACTISQEPNLPEKTRMNGAVALLYHDVLEELGMEQTIIVSHEPKMESYVENIINIVKTDRFCYR